MKVEKRDGSLVEFNKNKIIVAIQKGFSSLNYDITPKVVEDIASEVQIWDGISIEDIQDQIEELLMDWGYNDVAKEYILYRKERALARLESDKVLSDIHSALGAKNIQNQNANVDELSFGGRQGEAGRVASKHDALYYMMSEMSREHHLNNEDYVHDLDSYSTGQHNCLSVPFDPLLANGFNTRQTDVRPANSINTACQLVAVLFQLQSLQQFGGVSATHLDWTLVPYVRKSFFKHYVVAYIKRKPEFLKVNLEEVLFDDYYDKAGVLRNKFDEWIDENKEEILSKLNLTKDDFYFENDSLDPELRQSALFDTIQETKQAIEGMYHNLNTLQSRSGNQLPFTSINYGTNTTREGRMIIRALLKGSIKGVGSKHATAIFPCGIFQYMKGVNNKPGTPNYDLKRLALESTSRRLYPNYANVDWSGNAGYDINDPCTYFSTMGK